MCNHASKPSSQHSSRHGAVCRHKAALAQPGLVARAPHLNSSLSMLAESVSRARCCW